MGKSFARETLDQVREKLAMTNDNDMIRRGDVLELLLSTSGMTHKTIAAVQRILPAFAASHPADPAINADSRQRVTVKPLVWRPYPNPAFAGPDVSIADAEFSQRYQVQRDPWAASFMVYLHPTLPITSGTLWWESKGYPTLEAAKAAAQTDYEVRILAALDVQP